MIADVQKDDIEDLASLLSTVTRLSKSWFKLKRIGAYKAAAQMWLNLCLKVHSQVNVAGDRVAKRDRWWQSPQRWQDTDLVPIVLAPLLLHLRLARGSFPA